MNDTFTYWRMRVVITICLVVILLLFIIKLAVESLIESQGVMYEDLQAQEHVLKLDNMQLKNELLYQESYTRINQEAQKEGFVSGEFIYLK